MTKQSIPLMQQTVEPPEPASNWLAWLDALAQQRRLILSIALAVAALGAGITFLLQPAYEANLLLQVKESEGRDRSESVDGIAPRDGKVQAITEMEVLRSRAVLGEVVRELQLDILARPAYLPLVGRAIARWNHSLSEPGVTGGFVWGGERIEVARFTVPEELEGEFFILTALADGGYELRLEGQGVLGRGTVGQSLKLATPGGPLELMVKTLHGLPGAKFKLTRLSPVSAMEKLAKNMDVSERGRQSGLIQASLRGDDPRQVTTVLNAIGKTYIDLNTRMRTEEAERALTFLNQQLPDLKKAVERSEERYSEVRSRRGAVDTSEEARTILQQSGLAQVRSSELRQKKQELLTRYQPDHPSVIAIDKQLQEATRAEGAINSRIRALPPIQRDVVSVTRDLEVNKDVYTNMLNLSRQLTLAQLGKMGNVRLIDRAMVPKRPVWPVLPLALGLSILAGLLIGLLTAVVRKLLFAHTEDPEALEHRFGVPVLSTIPHSKEDRRVLLNHEQQADGVVDSLRTLRSALQFTMRESGKLVMLAGPTAGVGKSFISANFAAVAGSTGKRVLLIDADLRRGQLENYFDVQGHCGLAEILAGEVLPDRALCRNVAENLDLIPAGKAPDRPAELLERQALPRLLHHLAGQYDLVLIDTPPLIPFSDALAIANHVSTILLTVRAGYSHIGEVESAMKYLANAGHSVSGIVFNDMKHRSIAHRYGSAYGPKAGLYLLANEHKAHAA